MDRFKEMIDRGIASRDYKVFLPNTTETDQIVRTYNNCFGLFTDTHMSKYGDGYVITGSLCRNPEKFDCSLYSINYGLGTEFKVNGKTTSLSCFLGQNGLTGDYGVLNGDNVYFASPGIPSETGLDATCHYGVCGMDCKTSYPFRLGEKLVEVLSNIVENSKDLSELQRQVNESEQINGSDWHVFNTSKGFGVSSDSIGRAILFNICK